MATLSEAEKLEMLFEDLNIANETGDLALGVRARSEFYNMIASRAKKEGDQFTIYLLCLIEESDKLGMHSTAKILNIMAAFHQTGSLEKLSQFLEGYFQVCMDSFMSEVKEADERRKVVEHG